MKNLKLALLMLVLCCFNSCSNNNENFMETTDNVEKNSLHYNSDEARILYTKMLNSENQLDAYSSLDPKEKALVWQGKLDDFIVNSELNTEELNFIAELKSKLTIAFFENLKSTFDSEEIIGLEVKAGKIFGRTRALSLFYSLESYYKNSNMNQSKNCFWCNNLYVSTDGPCYWKTFNGVPQYVEPVTIRKVRFWLTVQEYTSVQPCSL